MTFVMRSVELRRERGWSQRHLAMVAAVSERTVQRLEKGLAISGESLLAIASALDSACNDLSAQPQAMFPVDGATVIALLRRERRAAVGVALAPDLQLADDVVARVRKTFTARRPASITRLVDDLQTTGVRVLAAEVQAKGGRALGFMLAPRTGTYTAVWRVA